MIILGNNTKCHLNKYMKFMDISQIESQLLRGIWFFCSAIYWFPVYTDVLKACEGFPSFFYEKYVTFTNATAFLFIYNITRPSNRIAYISIFHVDSRLRHVLLSFTAAQSLISHKILLILNKNDICCICMLIQSLSRSKTHMQIYTRQ